MSSMPREALNTSASKPGAISVPTSTLNALARAIGVSGETAEEVAPAFGTRRPRFLVARAESRLSRSDRPVDPQRGRAGIRLVDCGQRFFLLDRGCVNVVVCPEGEPQVHQISFHLLSLFGRRRQLTAHRRCAS